MEKIAKIGWESTEPVPAGHQFTPYLQEKNGRLHLDGLDLAQLMQDSTQLSGLDTRLTSPLEVVYLPLIRQRIAEMRAVFAAVREELNYAGQFHYAYASKANAAEEVIRTTLGTGAHHEMSSTIDVDIARLMIARGLLTPERMIICNGFKAETMDYAANIIRLHDQHPNLIPVVEDLGELPPLIRSGREFQVGIRQKCYGPHDDLADMDRSNSRFGMDLEDVWKAVDYISAAPNLQLTMYHAMVGSQILNREDFVEWLEPPMEVYARLRKRHPSLRIFNFGGGMPVRMTLNFQFDYRAFIHLLLATMQQMCARYDVPVPDIMGEFGRYTTSEHGAHLFSIITAKDNFSTLPWYIIDGSIMTSFPDSWALGEHFIVLPLNYLDQPFQQVRLGGITCDSDDVYPPHNSASPLYLPVETEGLAIGFFSIGAYQEMLGGVRGSKHCVLPEANELVVDRDEAGRWQYDIIPGQAAADVLRNLGYRP
jgi:arginine decarboxylase